MSKSLYFLKKVHNEKVQAYQKFYVDFVPRAPNLLKARLQHGCFFENFEKLFNIQPASLLKTTPAQLFFVMNLQNF